MAREWTPWLPHPTSPLMLKTLGDLTWHQGHAPHPLCRVLLFHMWGNGGTGKERVYLSLAGSSTWGRLPEKGQEETWNLRALGLVGRAVRGGRHGWMGPWEPETPEPDWTGS